MGTALGLGMGPHERGFPIHPPTGTLGIRRIIPMWKFHLGHTVVNLVKVHVLITFGLLGEAYMHNSKVTWYVMI